jgi:flagellar M-ring protein FliF
VGGLSDLIQRIGPGRFVAIGGTVLAVLAFLMYVSIRASKPDMSILFSQIDAADGGRVVDRLKNMSIPHEIRGDGSQIYVPTDDVAKIRMELAQEGLPAGGNVGYEIFDKSDVFSTTSALMDLNHLRALEGELSKSIRTIQGVAGCRVHLVLPKRELFSQTQQEPSASVVLKMMGNSKLSTSQAQAIQNLIASAVAGLSMDKISIIDDKGTLLAKGRETTVGDAENVAVQEDTRRNTEARLARTIEGLLEKTLGPSKTRAEVSLDMDFDKITMTSVEFNPDGQVARNVTSSQEGNNANEGGESTNTQNAAQEAASGARTQSNRNEESTNYEISNSTKTHIKEAGTVKRISVAVLVDGNYTKGADGKENYAPRSDQELEQLTTLVRTAVGFKEDRGDVVKVINMKFSDAERTIDIMEKPWYTNINLTKVIDLGLLGIFALLIGLFVLRPIISMLLNSDSGSAGPALASLGGSGIIPGPGGTYSTNENGETIYVDEAGQEFIYSEEDGDSGPAYVPKKGVKSMINIDNLDGRVQESSIKKIGEIIEKHPDEAVNILRSWMYAEK